LKLSKIIATNIQSSPGIILGLGLFLSIRNPCRGKRHFGWGLFYPYETPAGANGILGGGYFCGHNRESTHRIPLPGQMAFLGAIIFATTIVNLPIGYPCRGKRHFGWVLFLSIRNPWRGKRLFGWGLFYPYVTPAGANGM
jgi:hypothetical protein